jgi:intein/homing endonuclease
MPIEFSQQDEHLRRLLFTPCKTKKECHLWVDFFLDLDLPDCIVDPESNCTPLDMVWECYSHQVYGPEDEDVSRILYYACREGGKSLSESVIEIMLLFHARNNIFHLAAIKEQSYTVQGYLKKFLARPSLRPFVGGDSKSITGLFFYVPTDGVSVTLSKAEWEDLPQEEQETYISVNNNVEVLVATVQSCNSKHGMLVLDEIDVMLGDESRAAYRQSKFIPSEAYSATGERRLPLTVLTSTRKTAFGLVQDEINDAKKTGLVIRHWNILDVTQACPKSRHQPEKEKVTIYSSDELLAAMSEEDYKKLSSIEQLKYEKYEGCHSGCLNRCKIFSACKGRLVDKQTSTSPFLKSITHVQNQFRNASIDMSLAELLCFGKDTDILMADGTCKKIQDVVIGDRVITHTGDIRRVSNTFAREHDGDVCSFQQANWPRKTVVTPEHPYFINGKKFLPIGEAKPSVSVRKQYRKLGDYLSFPLSRASVSNRRTFGYRHFFKGKAFRWNNRIVLVRRAIPEHGIPNVFDLTKWGWIIGFYLAEGFQSKKGNYHHNDKGKNKKRSGIVFCTHVKETEYHEKIRQWAAEIGVSVCERKSSKTNGYTLVINNATLAELFFSFCGEHSFNKKLHPDLINMNNKFLADVLDGFWCGDGSKTNYKTRFESTTCSFDLASQLYLIAGRLGLCPKINVQKPAKGSKHTAYRVTYLRTETDRLIKNTKFKVEGNHSLYRLDEVERIRYDGTVYNLEVEGDNSYIANGVAVHNCVKPMTTGLVYPRLTPDKHVITPAEAYKKIMGEYPPNLKMTKAELVAFVRTRDVPWYGGMDFGYSHNFAYAHGFKDVSKLFVTHAFAMPELEPDQKVEAMEPFKRFFPAIYPDPEDPGMIRILKRKGYRMIKWIKGKGTVVGGISTTQMKLTPPLGAEPELFFVRDIGEDPGMDLLIRHLSEHHWKLDAGGKPTDLISDDNKDLPDALRYMVMGVFPYKGRMGVSSHTDTEQTQPTDVDGQIQYSVNNWMSQKIAELTGVPIPMQPQSREIKIQSLDGKSISFDYYSQENNKESGDDQEMSGNGILFDLC